MLYPITVLYGYLTILEPEEYAVNILEHNNHFKPEHLTISVSTLLHTTVQNTYPISIVPVQRSAQMSAVYPHIFLTVSKENKNMRRHDSPNKG